MRKKHSSCAGAALPHLGIPLFSASIVLGLLSRPLLFTCLLFSHVYKQGLWPALFPSSSTCIPKCTSPSLYFAPLILRITLYIVSSLFVVSQY